MKLPNSLQALSLLALSVLPGCEGPDACLFQVAQEGGGKSAKVILNHSASADSLCDKYFNKQSKAQAIRDACKRAMGLCCTGNQLGGYCGDVNPGM